MLVAVALVVAACSSGGEPADGSAGGSGGGSGPSPGDSTDQEGGPATGAAGGAATGTCDPARPADPGRTAEQVEVAGSTRSYLLEVPPGYDGETPVPLIVNLHGFGSTAEQQVLYSDLAPAAAEVDAVVASPDGTGARQGFSLSPDGVDVDLVATLLDELSERLCLDQDRLAATGISNGAALSAIAGCALGDRLASIGLVAATVGPFACDPATRVSVIAFHGTDDQVVPYGGGGVDSSGASAGVDVPPAEDGIAGWARQDGCDPGPATEDVAPDVDLLVFEDCPAGLDVQLYRVEGAGHVWPGSAIDVGAIQERLGPNTDSIDASALIVDFVATHPKVR